MTIFLAVLKIIGWILLVLLLTILLLLLLFLFFPFSYRIKGSVRDKKQSGKIRISWLFRLLNFHVTYDNDELSMYIRIFGIRIRLPKEKTTERDESQAKTNTGKSSIASVSSVQNQTDETKTEDYIPDDTSKNQDEYTFIDKIRDKWASLKQKLRNIQTSIQRVKIMIEDEGNRHAISHIKCECIRLLKCLMPYKLYLNVSYSAGSPDITAQIFGILAMFPIGYQNRWKIYPDFETEEWYAEGETDVAGNIFLFQLIAIVVRLILDKNCRRLITQWND